MNLYVFVLISTALFIFLDRISAPRLEMAIREDPTPVSMPRLALLGGIQFLRTSALIAAVTSGLLLALVAILTLFDGATAERVGSTIAALQGFRNILASVSPIWSGVVLGLCAFAMYRLSKRKAQLRVEEAFNRAANRDVERVVEEMRNGKAEDLPRSDDMQLIDEEIWKLQQVLEALQRDAPSDAPERQKQITDVVNQLVEQRAWADIRRRLNLRIDPDDVLDPPPVTTREKLLTFFVSRGLVRSMQGGNRLLFITSLALLVLSVVGVGSGTATTILDRRLIALGDLQVQLTEREATEEWKRAMAGSTASPSDLSSEDDRAVDILSREFEEVGLIRLGAQPNSRGERSFRLLAVQ
jgi:hypothetical protein